MSAISLHDRHPAVIQARGRTPISDGQLKKWFEWGSFPRTMRRHYLAQRGHCPYCCELLPLYLANASGNPATWDHVIPRSAGGGGHPARNKVLAHMGCNSRKSGRRPFACELLFCRVTNEIAIALHPEKCKCPGGRET